MSLLDLITKIEKLPLEKQTEVKILLTFWYQKTKKNLIQNESQCLEALKEK